MSLESGRKLGPYDILALVGAGGMGEVYRARDTRLNRVVALKVLPTGLASTPVARARFEREARAIAALSHPHICAIHDVGNDNGIEYLVMEYLEGESLAERLARGPLPLNLAVRYAAEIADALHHAHRANLVHRDLKPGNVMITASGVKLLDFGLARTISDEETGGDDAPTAVAPLTAHGTIIGTFQYMSPEQLEGKTLDHRTDIFTLGVVLYEMLVGQRPFVGETTSAIATAILTAEPAPIRSIQPNVTPELDRVVVTALEKNREERWQTAQDVGRQLRWIADGSSSRETVAAKVVTRRRLWPLGVIAALILVIAAVMMAPLYFRRAPPHPTSTTRLELSPPAGVTLVSGFDVNSLAVSPDGRTVAFVGAAEGGSAIYLRDLDSYATRKLEGSEGGQGLFWSPDGAWIAFSARGMLWKMKRSGDAPPVALTKVASQGATGTWTGQTILFSDAPESRTAIFRISADGGAAVALTSLAAGEWRHAWPYVLPGGRYFVYLALSRSFDRSVILARIDGTRVATILNNVSNVRAISEQELLFVRDGKLLAQRFDYENGKAVGEPVPVGDDVSYFHPTSRAEFDAVPSGVAVYRTHAPTAEMRIVGRDGAELTLIDGKSFLYDLSLSPDGNTVAATVMNRASGLADIWLYDLARGVRDPLTSEPGIEFAALWSRDGRSVVYASAQGGGPPNIVRQTAAGGESAEDLTPKGQFRYPESFSPDGEDLYFAERSAGQHNDIYRLSLSTRKIAPVVVTASSEHSPQVSPDGQRLAYTSDATGRLEIYLKSLSGDGARLRLSTHGGTSPQWSAAGELFFLGVDRRTLLSVRSGGDDWSNAKPQFLFTSADAISDYVSDRTGDRFVVISGSPGPRDDRLHVLIRGRE